MKILKQGWAHLTKRRLGMCFSFLLLFIVGIFSPNSVHAAPVISEFSAASSTSLPFGGGEVEFRWQAKNAVRCGSLGGSQTNFFNYFGTGGNGDGQGNFKLVIPITTDIELWCADSNDVFVQSQAIHIDVAGLITAPNFLEFSSDKTNLPIGGGSFTLTWRVTGATTCDIVGTDDFNASNLGGSAQRTISATTTYTMNCSNAAGTSTKSVTVTVLTDATSQCVFSGPVTWLTNCGATTNESIPVLGSKIITNTNAGYTGSAQFFCSAGAVLSGPTNETCTVSTGAPSVGFGSPTNPVYYEGTETVAVTLHWSSTGAVACNAGSDDGLFEGPRGVEGDETIYPTAPSGNPATRSYYLNCTNAAGQAAPGNSGPPRHSYVTTIYFEKKPPVVGFRAVPSQINGGETSVLKWDVSNAKTCEIRYFDSAGSLVFLSPPGTINIPSGGTGTGEVSVTPGNTTEYKMWCTSPQGGSLEVKARVTVGTGGTSCNNNGTQEVGEACDRGVQNGPPPAYCSVNCTINGDDGNKPTTCQNPAAKCLSLTDCRGGDALVGTCNNGAGVCCLPATTNNPVINNLIEVKNPLDFDTVEGLLNKILGFLQGIIAILSLIMIVIGSILYMTSAGDEKKASTGKVVITAALVGLALAIAAPSFLKEIGTILGWGNNVNGGAVQNAKTLVEILTTALNFLLAIVGVIAIIMLVIGGLMYLLSAGDEDRMKTGKKIVIYSLIGIAIALSALVLVTQVARLLA